MGFNDGIRQAGARTGEGFSYREEFSEREYINKPKRKRKLSAWNKFVKANSKKREFRYANGKLKLKKMGIAFRKKRRR